MYPRYPPKESTRLAGGGTAKPSQTDGDWPAARAALFAMGRRFVVLFARPCQLKRHFCRAIVFMASAVRAAMCWRSVVRFMCPTLQPSAQYNFVVN